MNHFDLKGLKQGIFKNCYANGIPASDGHYIDNLRIQKFTSISPLATDSYMVGCMTFSIEYWRLNYLKLASEYLIPKSTMEKIIDYVNKELKK